ncbi:uncharacterized protein RAG0_17087 [Rhynchosporium agropyri]|uniref:Zn(2)-C6 fungal-type domain-containing protein n=1 Tax=Rhynchosporium agropyri TaxID=914238 RepID=A0A1E1LUK5_9HELO|nr:uncharacterized protein RAG0_17087 [Rhynchosporium agropyri]
MDPSPKIHRTTGFSPSNSPRTAASPSKNQAPHSSHTTWAYCPSQQLLAEPAQAPLGKVVIPALKNPRSAASTRGLKHERIRHACDYCRKAKAACTGENACTRCLNANIRCIYGDGKRDKDKKTLVILSRKSASLSRYIKDVTEALHRIKLDMKLSSDDLRAAIDDVLQMAPTSLSSHDDESTLRVNEQSSELEEECISNNEDLDMVGLTGPANLTHKNTDRDGRGASAYMGESSSLAWAEQTVDENRAGGRIGLVLSSCHAEDTEVEFWDTSNILIQVPSSTAPPWLAHTFDSQTLHAYAPVVYSQEVVSDQLEQAGALHMFGSVGALHDYDDELHDAIYTRQHICGVHQPLDQRCGGFTKLVLVTY